MNSNSNNSTPVSRSLSLKQTQQLHEDPTDGLEPGEVVYYTLDSGEVVMFIVGGKK